MPSHASYHFNSSMQRVLMSDRCQVRCNFGRKKRGVRDDIKYT